MLTPELRNCTLNIITTLAPATSLQVPAFGKKDNRILLRKVKTFVHSHAAERSTVVRARKKTGTKLNASDVDYCV